MKIYAWRNNSGAFPASYKGRSRMVQFGAPGSPDIIAITSGLFVGIECKRPGGKQSEKQIAFQQNIERAGGYYILANSDNELEDGVKKIQYEQKRKRNSI